MNIRMEYLYRDAGNFKSWGEVVFANPRHIPATDVEKLLIAELFEGQYFLAEYVGLPDLHFVDRNRKLDHCLHEFCAIAETDEMPDDDQGRSINQFIDALRAGHPSLFCRNTKAINTLFSIF